MKIKLLSVSLESIYEALLPRPVLRRAASPSNRCPEPRALEQRKIQSAFTSLKSLLRVIDWIVSPSSEIIPCRAKSLGPPRPVKVKVCAAFP